MDILKKYENFEDKRLDIALESLKKEIVGKELILYGVSSTGRTASKTLLNNNINIKYFCDDCETIQGQIVNGIKILSFDEILKLGSKENFVFLITTRPYHKVVCDKLMCNNFNQICYYPELLIDTISPLKLDEYSDSIGNLFKILSDEKSKLVVKNIIENIVTRNIDQLSLTRDDIQYFDEEIIKLSPNEVLVDAGAYTGDTIKIFNELTGGTFEKIYAFEPDEKNFEILEKTSSADNIVLHNSGLYGMNGKIGFVGGIAAVSHVCEENIKGREIDVVKLDDMIMLSGNDIPTFIKMDIEGAEIAALQGAEKIIKMYKPKLAICIYHELEHLWDIPLYIKNMVPEYDIFIRHYTNSIVDTICYAVIK